MRRCSYLALLVVAGACAAGCTARNPNAGGRDLSVGKPGARDMSVPDDLASEPDLSAAAGADLGGGVPVDMSDDAGPATPGGPFGVYVLYETFNAMTTAAPPSGVWAVNATGGASVLVQEVPFAADKSCQIAKPTSSGDASLTTTFPAQSGRVVFEAKVKAAETAGFKAIPYIYDGSGNAVASIAFQDGNIEAHIGGTISTVQSFAANTWYRVRTVIDTNKGNFDLFVDGVRMLTAQPLRMASPSVASLGFFIDGTNTGTLYVDNIKVYNEADYIGAPPGPMFDPRDYGAAANGTTMDTVAIQKAVDAANNTGGAVILRNGTFLSGTITLHGNMTFFVDSSATLLGSANAADYPTQSPSTGSTQLINCQRALLYAPNTSHLIIDGGGTINGQGDSFSGVENTRPMIIWAVQSNHLTIRNLYLTKSAVWTLVSMESDDVSITNMNVQSNNITHDGIDIVDGSRVTVDECAVRAGDDAMCLKSGVRRGIDTLTVSRSIFGGYSNSGGSNGIKFGTATYGALNDIAISDCTVKDVQYAAMAVESRQGSDISNIAFNRVEFSNSGAAFFVYLAQQNDTHPVGDVPKLGSIDGVAFTDIRGTTSAWGNSPHQGSLITGQIYNTVAYAIQNLSFTNVAVTFDGGLSTVPASPPEAMPDQYPESNMFGDLPAWGYYLRHVAGVSFANCTSTAANSDARQKLVTDDVANLTGTP